MDIIQLTDIGIIVVDEHFTIEIYNRFMQVHSGLSAEGVIGQDIRELFPSLKDEWFTRRVKSVFDLGIPVYTTWEQRDNVFDFSLQLPIHHETQRMYQNSTFVPLHSSLDEVEKVGIVVYDVTGMAVSKLKLEHAQQELLQLSRTDKMTALFNRGHWEERAEEEYKHKQRSDDAVTLVIFDIDHFKAVNDNFGHQVGDEAIRLVSRSLRENCREIEICGRYGGEEFTVILPLTDRKGAMVFLRALASIG